MVKIENECCGCAVPAYPCIGDECKYRHVTRYFCDKCGDETTLYVFDGRQMCGNCIKNEILKDLEIVEESEEFF